MVTAVNVTPS